MTGSAKQSRMLKQTGLLRRFAPRNDAGLRPVVADLGAALCDQARAALAAGVDPQPVDGDAEPVAQADQEVDVGDAPDPPRQRAAHLDPAEIDYGQPLADLRQIAGVLVGEWSNVATGETRLDGSG